MNNWQYRNSTQIEYGPVFESGQVSFKNQVLRYKHVARCLKYVQEYREYIVLFYVQRKLPKIEHRAMSNEVCC